MYADRYAGQQKPSPGGIAFALGGSALIALGLTLATPNVLKRIETVLIARPIPLPADPPPIEEIKPKPKTEVRHVKTAPIDPIDLTKTVTATDAGGFTGKPVDIAPSGTLTVGTGDEIGTALPPHVAVLRGPTLDSRYIDSFQPSYPSDMRLAGRDGRVVVSVLIGIDGRVKDVRQISAASTAFFEATRRQALAKWRFKPGTKDGVAVEAWHTMAVSFVLDEE